jgi:hypothetical protein
VPRLQARYEKEVFQNAQLRRHRLVVHTKIATDAARARKRGRASRDDSQQALDAAWIAYVGDVL